MDRIKKLFSSLKQKAAEVVTGGFDIVRRANVAELNSGNYLEQYGKSLYVTACISKIAEKVASTELELYRVKNSKGDMNEILVHPILDLLSRPNPFQTKTEFWETTVINLKCTGDAYWLKLRNKGGKVVELWNMRPDLMTINSDPEVFIKSYEFQKADGSKLILQKDDVVHFKYPDPLSQYFGLSPIKSASRRIQTEEYATRYQMNFFVNSARPDAIIKNKSATLSKLQSEELREGWEKKYKGISNGSKIAILHGDLEYQQISLSQREMDYIESMKFTRDDILVIMKVPKPLLSIVDDVNRANSETAMFIFLSETIKPEVARIVEKINEELVYVDFGEEYYVDFEDPTPENRDLELREYSEGIQNNYLLINEVRQKEGLEPIAGGWSIYLPFTVQAMGGLAQGGKKENNKVERGMILKEFITDPNTLKKQSKKFSFKGHYWLREKFLMRESIIESAQKIVAQAFENKSKKQTGNKKKEIKKTSYLQDKVFREAYFFKTNQKIDLNSTKLSVAMNEFATRQKARVLEKLSKKKEIKNKLDVKQIINKDKETQLTVSFITPFLENYIMESAKDALDTLAPQEIFNSTVQIQAFITARAQKFGNEVTETTIDKLSNTLSEGLANGENVVDLSDRINAVYDEFPTYRSDMIARTESTAANAKGAIEGFRQSNVSNGKEWINSGDDRVRDEHQDAPIGVGSEIVGLDAAFSNGLTEPGEPNCRCVLGPAFIEG